MTEHNDAGRFVDVDGALAGMSPRFRRWVRVYELTYYLIIVGAAAALVVSVLGLTAIGLFAISGSP